MTAFSEYEEPRGYCRRQGVRPRRSTRRRGALRAARSRAADRLPQRWKPGIGGRVLGRAALALALACAPGCGGEANPPAPPSPAATRAPAPPSPAAMRAPVPPSPADARAPAPPAAPDHRNVLLITIDTLRADALGAYGNALDPSPRIDRLAAEGVLFERCSATAPSTLPSHASILTAKYPYHHGARANLRYRLAKGNVTLAERLAAAGFATAAETAAVVLARRTQMDQGFAVYRDVDSPDVEVSKPAVAAVARRGLTSGTRDAADVTRHGIGFIREHRDEPFFLWLHYFDPHQPYAPPPDLALRFRDSPYHGEVANVDRHIGRLLDALASSGLAANTLVVLTSDHGESLGEHGEDTHSNFVYESTIRVPLVFWGPPDIGSGVRIAAPVRTVDIAPTVLDWLGLPPFEQADGASLLPLIHGHPDFAVRVAYGESTELQLRYGASILRFLREGPWKYIHKVRPELYNLDEDPGELVNRAAQEPERLKELRARLRELLAEAGPAPEGGTLAVDAETADQLVALGYAGTGRMLDVERELDAFEVSGVDPNDLVEEILAYNRGHGLLMTGEAQQALEIFDDLAERYPQSTWILVGQLEAQLQLGHSDEALALLRRGIALDPDYQRFWNNLFELQLLRGEEDAARETLRGYHERWPCDVDARLKWANLTGKHDGRRAQLAILEQGVEACGEDPELANDIAFALATAPDPELRDGARAVTLAEQAVAARRDDPLVLDTLAAAYAADGRMEEAAATSRRALGLARRDGLPEPVLRLLARHATQLERGEPIVE